MIEKVKVIKITHKDGEGAAGTWKKVGILVQEEPAKWIGAFETKYNAKKLAAIVEGSEIEVVITKSGEYFNFDFPNKVDKLEARVEVLEQKAGVGGPTAGNTDVTYPTEQTGAPDPADIDF